MRDKAMPKDDAAARRKAFPIRIFVLLPSRQKMKAKYVPVSLALSPPPRSHCNRKSSKPPSDAHSSTRGHANANLPGQATLQRTKKRNGATLKPKAGRYAELC